jgi:hypothetical protein
VVAATAMTVANVARVTTTKTVVVCSMHSEFFGAAFSLNGSLVRPTIKADIVEGKNFRQTDLTGPFEVRNFQVITVTRPKSVGGGTETIYHAGATVTGRG